MSKEKYSNCKTSNFVQNNNKEIGSKIKNNIPKILTIDYFPCTSKIKFFQMLIRFYKLKLELYFPHLTLDIF